MSIQEYIRILHLIRTSLRQYDPTLAPLSTTPLQLYGGPLNLTACVFTSPPVIWKSVLRMMLMVTLCLHWIKRTHCVAYLLISFHFFS